MYLQEANTDKLRIKWFIFAKNFVGKQTQNHVFWRLAFTTSCVFYDVHNFCAKVCAKLSESAFFSAFCVFVLLLIK